MHLKKISGQKVYLSPFMEEDCEKLLKWSCDEAVVRNTGRYYVSQNVVNMKKWLSKALEDGEHCYAICRKDTDEFIGDIGFYPYEPCFRRGTLGIQIGEKDSRGKGFGGEAMKLFLEFAFNELGMVNINLEVFDFNISAYNLYKKIGFKEIGRRRSAYFTDGKWHDIISMDILKDELIL